MVGIGSLPKIDTSVYKQMGQATSQPKAKAAQTEEVTTVSNTKKEKPIDAATFIFDILNEAGETLASVTDRARVAIVAT